VGNSSEITTHTPGPIPKEKNATQQRINVRTLDAVAEPVEKTKPNAVRDTPMPAAAEISSVLRPRRSMVNNATTVKTRFIAPTNTFAVSVCRLPSRQ
jgi:hypothetical protein